VERPLNSPTNENCRRRRPDLEPLVVVVLGPTASGKTALALAIARRFNGEIVNCDSVAMYREFEIGTAKPTAAERAEIPHHLLDCVDPRTDVTAGEYARQARQVLRDIASQRKPQRKRRSAALAHRHRAAPDFTCARCWMDSLPGRNVLRNSATNSVLAPRNRVLNICIASSGDSTLRPRRRIHANDIPKVIRALEVSLAARRPMTQLWQEGREPLPGFRILRLGLNPGREALYARINQRAAKMFDEGLIAETKTLLAKYGERTSTGRAGLQQACSSCAAN
jgi:tRNA dimethylallyltransferase